jgi:hypothetical protein
VISGACAGICYNALWYFPVLIIVGGIITVLWDAWLAQKVGKFKAKWQNSRRRARDEVGDAEESSVSQEVQPAQQLQVQRPEAVKRRTQADSSTDRTIPEDEVSGAGRSNRKRSTGNARTTEPTPLVDVKTHNISIKLGISLVIGFLGKISH